VRSKGAFGRAALPGPPVHLQGLGADRHAGEPARREADAGPALLLSRLASGGWVERLEIESRPTGARTARLTRGRRILRCFVNGGVGGQQQPGNGGRVPQCGARDLGRIEHARLDQVAVFGGLCVVAEITRAFRDLRDDHARFFAGIRDDLTQRFFERAQHDLDTRVLIGIHALLAADRLLHANQCHAAARHDAFFDGCARGMQCVVDTVFLFLDLDFGRAAHLDDRDAASQLRHAFLQLFAVVMGSCFLDLHTDLLDARFDILAVASAVDDSGVFLADFDALVLTQFGERRFIER
jgi:hypothetical protein